MGITQRARGVLRRREPAETVGTRNAVYGPALPDESTVHLVMDLGLRIGEVQMASGAGASDVTATIIGVVSAYGLPHCEVDVIYTSITVSCYRGTESVPITSLRVVRNRSIDYTRLDDVEKLVRRITAGEMSAAEAYSELDQITSAPHPFPRWVATLAWAGMAASLSVLLGGGPRLAIVAAVATALVDRIGRVLNKRALPFFFQQAVGGAIATTIALLCSYRESFLPEGSGALAVAASIIVLLSGMTVVGSMQDAITGYNVTAAGRIAEIALMSAGLIAGVVLALYTGSQLFGQIAGDPRLAGAMFKDVGGAQIESKALVIPVQTLAGASTSACFALASYAPPRPLIVAGLGGAVAAGVSATFTSVLALDPVLAGAVATTVVGVIGGVVARRLEIPALVIAVSGVAPLLPGLATYRGLYEIVVFSDPNGMSTLMLAAATGLALGAGVVLGEYLAQPVRTRLGRLERKLVGPRLSGPLRPTRRRLE
ncbi:threonine/serine exporter family protein [Saccharopolyspora sp. HNM0986]|uniref:threonine/serine ThrE exporter family protein n=2 Tax=Saccharopolyspora TaxID=1835 RepID=UPI00190994DC|nr:threonine/serine exporter family protein [Saccharopolyspora sp. HNM0986]MBK0865652.1 threonine/serine exporter family protein [Saccharopolyspora sp. HNM0986]